MTSKIDAPAPSADPGRNCTNEPKSGHVSFARESETAEYFRGQLKEVFPDYVGPKRLRLCGYHFSPLDFKYASGSRRLTTAKIVFPRDRHGRAITPENDDSDETLKQKAASWSKQSDGDASKWSPETMNKAAEIREMVSLSGYQKLYLSMFHSLHSRR